MQTISSSSAHNSIRASRSARPIASYSAASMSSAVPNCLRAPAMMLLVAVDDGARLQAIDRAAVWTLRFAAVRHVEKYARMRAPDRHGGIRAVGRQILAFEFDCGSLLRCCGHVVLRIACLCR